jgi:hypothetical protein
MQRRGHDLRKYGITDAWFRIIHRVFQEDVALLLEPMKSPVILVALIRGLGEPARFAAQIFKIRGAVR